MIKYPAIFYLIAALCIILVYPLAYGAEIDIIGSSKFKQQTRRALILLEDKAPRECQIVEKYVGRIEENQRSGMFAYRKPPTFQMSSRVAFYSVTWCAGSIAHDSYHSKLYHDYIKINGEPVPYDAWAGFEAEKKCIKYQLEVLNKIKAPMREISHCASSDGTHSDVNKDGKIDKTDYNLRDW